MEADDLDNAREDQERSREERRLIQLGLLPNPNECNVMAMEGNLRPSGVLVEPYERLLHEFADRIAWQQSQLDTAGDDLYQARRQVEQLSRAVGELGRECPLDELHRRMVHHVLGWPEPDAPLGEGVEGLDEQLARLAPMYGLDRVQARITELLARNAEVIATRKAEARESLAWSGGMAGGPNPAGGRGSDGPDWG